MQITGRVSPAEAGRRVELQRRTGGHWRTLGASVTIAADGQYATTLAVSGRGRIVLRVYRAATTTNAAGTSRVVTLHIT